MLTAWMNFEDIMPSEIRQSQKHTDLTHMDVLKAVKLIETEWWLPGIGVKGNGNYSLMGTEFQFSKVKRVLLMDSCDVCITVQMYLMLLYT